MSTRENGSDPMIVVTRRWPAQVEGELRRTYSSVRFNADDIPLGPAGLRRALREADVVLTTVSDRFPAEVFDAPVRTRFLGNFGAGHEHIDLDAAARAGIVVTNTPHVLTDTTADATMTLLLMVARRAGEGERELRAGRWTGWRPTHLLGVDVTSKTLGIVGMGRIGAAVARRARFGFGMRVVYHTTNEKTPDHGVPDAVRLDSVEEVLEAADFVSLHVPGGRGNTHLVGAERLARMKPTGFLLNTSRGEVVDQRALVTALRNGTIAGAGLDVYEGEPEVPYELLEMDNVVLLPHLGSATSETRVAMGMLTLANLRAFLNGGDPPCRVV